MNTKTNSHKKRILTGDNTTGNLHVGHYVGSLQNRASLVDDYDTIIVLADAHAFAYDKYAQEPGNIEKFTLEVAIDNMSVGIDPEKATYFVDSAIPEIFEISYLLSAYISYPRNLRNPTLKDEIRDKKLGENYSMAFLNFPILMASDILSVKADLVPVGEDQLPHIELTREVARRFNNKFGDTFVEPNGLVGKVARLVGTDGNAKMTKSLGNTIFLKDSPDEVREKVKTMYTDPNRLKATDPGTVEGNPVFIYHDAFNTNTSEVEELKDRYRKGTVGDVEVKEKLAIVINEFLDPIRERRSKYENDIDYVKQVISQGNSRVRGLANETLTEMRERLNML